MGIEKQSDQTEVPQNPPILTNLGTYVDDIVESLRIEICRLAQEKNIQIVCGVPIAKVNEIEDKKELFRIMSELSPAKNRIKQPTGIWGFLYRTAFRLGFVSGQKIGNTTPPKSSSDLNATPLGGWEPSSGDTLQPEQFYIPKDKSQA